MKKLLLSAAVIAAMSTGAFATDQNINLSASVAAFCSIDGSTTNSTSADASAITVVEGVPTATPTNPLRSMAVVCNSNSTVALQSQNGGLTGSNLTSTAPFAHVIHYTATAGGFATATLSTASNATTAVTANITGAKSDNLTITIGGASLPSGRNYLLADNNYQDVLKVSVNPAP